MAYSCDVFTLVLIGLCGNLVDGEANVYDHEMQACGPSHAAGCAYVSQDAGAHEVCVTELPAGFSDETGQGSWSEAFTGKPWCICIWAYSNYILQSKDLSLQCESIPSKVLEEQYSLSKFQQCGSMSSTAGCGAEDIRRSIQSLCTQCGEQASDDAARDALKSKCDAILSSAPLADMSRLYSEGVPIAKDRSESGTASFILGVSAFSVAGVILGVAARSFPTWRRRTVDFDQDLSDVPTSGEEDGVFARVALVPTI